LIARGLAGDYSDIGRQGGVPHYHGATMSLDLVQGEIGIKDVFRVQIDFVDTTEGMKKMGEVTLVQHWFTQKYKLGEELFSEVTERVIVTGEAFNIPR
jgi:hypothetical protein